MRKLASLVFICLCNISALHAFLYQVSLCAIFQNDAPYLKEWIDHHQKQGVEHFWLYSHLSTDHFREVLQPYIESGNVELIEWPYPVHHLVEWNEVQCFAYMDCVNRCKNLTQWCAFLDTDEYLFCPNHKPLGIALIPYQAYSGVGINWIVYGTSRVAKILPHEKLVDKLVYRVSLDNPVCLHIKTIAQPARIVDCKNPHFFFYNPYYPGAVTENKMPIEGPFSAYVSVNIFRINHYWSRDEDFFYHIKIPRQIKWGIPGEFCLEIEKKYSEIHDPILSTVLP